MLNEERIILMTRLASYEANKGKRDVATGHYFRGDYVALQVLKAFFGVTIAFLILTALYILYDFETFMQNIYKMDLLAFAKNIMTAYGVSVAVYCVISFFAFSARYSRAKKGMRLYHKNLKKLSSLK